MGGCPIKRLSYILVGILHLKCLIEDIGYTERHFVPLIGTIVHQLGAQETVVPSLPFHAHGQQVNNYGHEL